MSSQTGKWREDQVLIICPGSQTTLAQLGCSELTPPAHRFPTRMFWDKETDGWRPYHTYKRKKASTNATPVIEAPGADDDEFEWVEDTDSDEGAVYPMKGGRIKHMEAFLAFLDHVHSMLTTTYHNTPIMLMASPQWTRPDIETIARYIFEKTRTPTLCIIHSALATQYGLKWPNMTVVDIGFEKVDVTCLYDSNVVSHYAIGEGTAGPKVLGNVNSEQEIYGGEAFTQKLLELLKPKDFTYDMAEQLKKSAICEVLPFAPNYDQAMELPTASATGAPAAPADQTKAVETSKGMTSMSGETGAEEDAPPGVNEDGVLDVASIVTSGNTREFLAKKEKDKGKGRKGKGQDQEPAKPTRLPNSKRTHNVFHFEEIVQEWVQPEPVAQPTLPTPAKTDAAPAATTNGDATSGEAAPTSDGTKEETLKDVEEKKQDGEQKDTAMTDGTESAPAKEAEPASTGAATGEEAPATADTIDNAETKTESAVAQPDAPAAPTESAPAPAPAPAAAPVIPQEPRLENKLKRRDIEVGLERFLFADRQKIDCVCAVIYRAIQDIPDMYMRPACWDNLVFVGNGARLRGLKENIMQTLQGRYLISPSTATMFTSELPSNMATPTGTGAQTPTSSYAGVSGQLALPNASSGVNPLLQAATAGAAAGGAPGTPGGPGSDVAGGSGQQHSSHFHSQTPTSIKLAPLPSYLAEWSKHGFEESMFLGAQVAARLAFCIHNLDMAGLEAQRSMSLSRVDYNELGPKGIRTHSMLP